MDLLSGSINGLVLASVPIILNYMNIHSNLYLWIILIVVSYILAFSLNATVQLIVCKQIYPVSLAKNSLWLPVFVAFFLGLSYIGFLSWAIEGCLPSEMDSFTKQGISHAFYIFWGGMYGQLLSSGFAQSCR